MENVLNENIIIEDIDIEFTTAEDFIDNFDNCFSSETLNYDIDWPGVIGKFSIGTAIIVCTGVISFSSVALGQKELAFLFATSSKEAIKEALIGAAIGGALNTIVETIKNGGVIEEYALKYAIEGAADGFMWGSISGALLGLYKGVNILAKNPILDDFGKLIGIPDESGRLLNAYGEKSGNILKDGFIEDGSHKIIGKLDNNGKFNRNYRSYIPENGFIYVKKNPRFKIENKNVYRIYNDELVGTIDDAGRIIKDGKIVSYIDENGKLLGSVSESANNGVSILPDGTVNNLNNFDIKNSNEKGIRNIFSKDTKKIVGQIDDNDKLILDWRKKITNSRNIGVKSAKTCIMKMKFSYSDAIKRGIMDESVTKLQYETFIKTGKGLEGHHINNVANYPNYADRSDNIVFVGKEAHKELHKGNYKNATKGKFTKLKCN